MTINLTCSCGAILELDTKWAGQKIRCPDCDTVAIVPFVESPVIVSLDSEEEIVEVVPLDEEVIEDLPAIADEQEIPELDVEEVLPPWAMSKKAEKLKLEKPSHQEDDAEKVRSSRSIVLLEKPMCLALGSGAVWGLANDHDEVRILNLKAGKMIQLFREHLRDITSVALSLDGEFALSGDADGALLFWQLVTRRVKRTLIGHHGPVACLAMAPDSKHAVSGGVDGRIQLWKLEDSQPLPLSGSGWKESISTVAWGCKGTMILAGSANGRVCAWQLATRKRQFNMRFGDQPISSVQSSYDGVLLTVVAKPALQTIGHPRIWRWNVQKEELVPCFQKSEPPRSVPKIALLDHGGRRLLIAGGSLSNAIFEKGKNSIEIWNVATGACLHVYSDLEAAVEILTIAPDNGTFLAALSNRRLLCLDMPSL